MKRLAFLIVLLTGMLFACNPTPEKLIEKSVKSQIYPHEKVYINCIKIYDTIHVSDLQEKQRFLRQKEIAAKRDFFNYAIYKDSIKKYATDDSTKIRVIKQGIVKYNRDLRCIETKGFYVDLLLKYQEDDIAGYYVEIETDDEIWNFAITTKYTIVCPACDLDFENI